MSRMYLGYEGIILKSEKKYQQGFIAGIIYMLFFSGRSLRVFFFGDYELLNKMYGICGCNGKAFNSPCNSLLFFMISRTAFNHVVCDPSHAQSKNEGFMLFTSLKYFLLFSLHLSSILLCLLLSKQEGNATATCRTRTMLVS